MSVSEFTKKYVRNRADYLREYCHSPEKISASRFTISFAKKPDFFQKVGFLNFTSLVKSIVV
jgi:hypothetical protein